ncbi:ABC transporter substrate-binding protein [Cohnella sp. LGH]|uniref:ABC transporter substrate-binding protein n=1 Tax=Cohnella sp. LGH TaxID=1619153 RepID=UPI001FFE06B5|nr:ABC transporter substrate-binding protein [Cohnella sp. LGH]
MMNGLSSDSVSVPLSSLLFHFVDIERIEHNAAWYPHMYETDLYTLLIVTDGQGRLFQNRELTKIAAAKCYWLNPGVPFRLVNECDAIRCYRLTFAAVQIQGGEYAKYDGEILPEGSELAALPFTRLSRLADILYEGRRSHGGAEGLTRQAQFNEMLAVLFEHNVRAGHSSNPLQAIELTISYMRNNYMYPITVKQLAEISQLVQWQYSAAFQKLTGKKPLDYLTDVRIGHAKEWLRLTAEPLREIARRVGFADEYYFNRRFRQSTGMTPRQYSQSTRGKIRVKDWTGHEVDIPASPQRIIYHGETLGDLSALGIRAIGTSDSFKNNGFLEERERGFLEVGMPIDPGKAQALKPDLIIFANADENQYNALSKIAPTVTFNTFAPLEHRLHTLGQWLGRKREAEQWLSSFNPKAAAMWNNLRSVVRQGHTASVFVYEHGEHLFVMGASGLSSALYHPCGFQAADGIRDIVEAGVGFAEIPPDRLPEYAGDHVFMLLSENEQSRRAALAMMESSLWRSLPAVRSGCVYVLEADAWNYNDAKFQERLLNMLPLVLNRIS